MQSKTTKFSYHKSGSYSILNCMSENMTKLSMEAGKLRTVPIISINNAIQGRIKMAE